MEGFCQDSLKNVSDLGYPERRAKKKEGEKRTQEKAPSKQKKKKEGAFERKKKEGGERTRAKIWKKQLKNTLLKLKMM